MSERSAAGNGKPIDLAKGPPANGAGSNGANGKPVLPTRLPPAGAAARRGGGPPWMTAGMPAEKSMNFGPSARRLMRRLRPERPLAFACSPWPSPA